MNKTPSQFPHLGLVPIPIGILSSAGRGILLCKNSKLLALALSFISCINAHLGGRLG